MTTQLKRYRMHSPDGVAGAMTDMVLASDHAAAVAALEKERDELAQKYSSLLADYEGDFFNRVTYKRERNKALDERDAALARLAELWKHCHVTYWPPDGSYPIEHNPHAQKDMRAAIEAALSQEKRGDE